MQKYVKKSQSLPFLKALLGYYLLWGLLSMLFAFPLPPGFITDTSLPLVVFAFLAGYLLLGLTLSSYLFREICRNEIKIPANLALLFSLAMCLTTFYLAHKGVKEMLFLGVFGTVNLLVFATMCGALLSSAIKRVAELIPICITAGVADTVSVFFGPTKDMAASLGKYYQEGMVGPPPFIDFIVVKFVVPGFVLPLPFFGVTDWIILILLSSALYRLGLNDNLLSSLGGRKVTLFMPVSGLGLLMSISLAQFFNIFLPALPLICLCFALYIMVKFRAHQSLNRSDMVLSVVFPVVMAATILLSYR